MRLLILAIASLSLVGLSGCDSESDPATASLDDLSIPGNVVSVTKSGSLELRWVSSNAEDDFGGYYVFATTKTYSELQALVAYPDGAKDNLTQAGVPRCEDNSSFFEAFGIAASDADCEGGVSDSSITPTLSQISAEDAEAITGFVPCSENSGSENYSLEYTDGPKNLVKCTISKAWDATNSEQVDIANGTTYTVFVMSVETDRKTVSWSSNVVVDTPSRTAFSTETSVTIPEDQFVVISLDSDSFSSTDDLTVSSAAACATSTSPCKLTDLNSQTGTTTSGIYLGRDVGSSTYTQRIYISTHSTQTIKLLPRGPQTLEKTDGTTASRVSGDEAVANPTTSSPYAAAGTKFTVYNNQVFDLVVGDDSYGKVHIGEVSYASDSKTGDATVEVTIVLQPTAGVTHYLYDF